MHTTRLLLLLVLLGSSCNTIAVTAHNPTWYINTITSTRNNNFYRVACTIAGQEVWFESNVPLKASPEAFVGIFVIPALSRGATIQTSLPIDREWHENIAGATSIYHEWWGLPIRNPVQAKKYAPRFEKHTSSTGCTFSCGVDSFYTVFSGENQIDALVFCQGLDVSLDDNKRASMILSALEKISRNLQKKYFFVRTNIRSHALFKSFDWSLHMHGTALIALGHLLSEHIDRFVISPSNYPEPDKAYGSHWRTDHFFSSSSLQIVHSLTSEQGARPLRTATIAPHEIVQENLRVCWVNRAPWNCSRCEKCVRTMIDLCACDALKKFGKVFDLSVPLVHRIISLGKLDEDQIYMLKKCIQPSLPLEVKQAIAHIIKLSS